MFQVRTFTRREAPVPISTFTRRKVEAHQEWGRIKGLDHLLNMREQLDEITDMFASNLISRTLSIILAQYKNEVRTLQATKDGHLIVSLTGGAVDTNQTISGIAGDTYQTVPHSFFTECTRTDIYTWDNPALIKISRDGVVWGDEFEIPANYFLGLDLRIKEINIRNRDAGFPCRFQFLGWFTA